MTTYKFFNGSISGNPKQQMAYATPGDTNTVVIRRGFVDTSKQTLTAATPDIAQAVPLAKNEIVLGVWARVITAESTANAEFTLGFDANNTRFTNGIVATTANTVASSFDEAVPVTANTSAITVVPSNSVDMDTAVIEVCAMVTKSFDNDGDLPDPTYGYPLS